MVFTFAKGASSGVSASDSKWRVYCHSKDVSNKKGMFVAILFDNTQQAPSVSTANMGLRDLVILTVIDESGAHAHVLDCFSHPAFLSQKTVEAQIDVFSIGAAYIKRDLELNKQTLLLAHLGSDAFPSETEVLHSSIELANLLCNACGRVDDSIATLSADEKALLMVLPQRVVVSVETQVKALDKVLNLAKKRLHLLEGPHAVLVLNEATAEIDDVIQNLRRRSPHTLSLLSRCRITVVLAVGRALQELKEGALCLASAIDLDRSLRQTMDLPTKPPVTTTVRDQVPKRKKKKKIPINVSVWKGKRQRGCQCLVKAQGKAVAYA